MKWNKLKPNESGTNWNEMKYNYKSIYAGYF